MLIVFKFEFCVYDLNGRGSNYHHFGFPKFLLDKHFKHLKCTSLNETFLKKRKIMHSIDYTFFCTIKIATLWGCLFPGLKFTPCTLKRILLFKSIK